MEKEYIIRQTSSVTLNITGGQIDSYRKQEETNGTVRVYQDGKIGVAGMLGEPDEARLTEQAQKALELGIPYTAKLDGPEEREERHDPEILPERELVPTMQKMLDRISEACPRFAISHKIMLTRSRSEYRNSNGRHLTDAHSALSIALLFQDRGSGNLMDAFYEYQGRNFDPDAVVAGCKEIYDAFYTPADIEDGVWPVVMGPWDLFSTLLRHFVGEMYVSGASLVSGRLGEKLFSEKLTLANDRNPETVADVCFFDEEGQTAPDYRAPLIEHGVLKNVLTSKNTAEQYGLPSSQTSDAAYDGVPAYGLSAFYVEPTAEKLRDLVPGKAVYVLMASGGDTTPSGHFATPVQVARLMENGRFVGRLPELNVSGDFFSLLGEDYLGAVHGDPGENDLLCAVKMKVEKI